MRHVIPVTRPRERPAEAAEIEQIAKVLGEALTLTGQLLVTLTTWETLQETKTE